MQLCSSSQFTIYRCWSCGLGLARHSGSTASSKDREEALTAGQVEITNATIYEFWMFLLLSWKNDFPI